MRRAGRFYGPILHQVESMRRTLPQPSVLCACARLDATSDDHRRRPVCQVQHSADRVVEGGLGIEPACGRCGQPINEAIDEATEPVDLVPLPSGVEVKTQAVPFKHMGVVQESKVIHINPRRKQVRRADSDVEVLIFLKR